MRIKTMLLGLSLLLIASVGHADDRIGAAVALADLSLTSQDDNAKQANGATCNYYGSGVATTMVCTYQDAKGSCATVGTSSGSHSIGDHPGCPNN